MTEDQFRNLCLTIGFAMLCLLLAFWMHTRKRSSEEEIQLRGAVMAGERKLREIESRERCHDYTYVPLGPDRADCASGMDMNLTHGFDYADITRVTCTCPKGPL